MLGSTPRSLVASTHPHATQARRSSCLSRQPRLWWNLPKLCAADMRHRCGAPGVAPLRTGASRGGSDRRAERIGARCKPDAVSCCCPPLPSRGVPAAAPLLSLRARCVCVCACSCSHGCISGHLAARRVLAWPGWWSDRHKRASQSRLCVVGVEHPHFRSIRPVSARHSPPNPRRLSVKSARITLPVAVLLEP